MVNKKYIASAVASVFFNVGYINNVMAKDVNIFECSAKAGGVVHNLKISALNNDITSFSYTSIDQSTGDTCDVSASKVNDLPTRRIDWDVWPNAVLIGFHEAPSEFNKVPMRALVLKTTDGYQLSIEHEARLNYCGLHAYIYSTVILKKGIHKCVLFDKNS